MSNRLTNEQINNIRSAAIIGQPVTKGDIENICIQAREANRLRAGLERFLDDLDELHSGPYENMFLYIRELLEDELLEGGE